jgi:hypothetical protein
MIGLLAARAHTVEDDFGVADGIVAVHAQGADNIAGDKRVFETLESAAAFADEMGMLMGVGDVGAEAVAKNAIFAPDAMKYTLAGEGVEGPVDGDGIGVRGEFSDDFDGAEGAYGLK